MPIFRDTKNTEWSIEIEVDAIKRVMNLTGHNLTLPHEADEHGQTLCDRLLRDLLLQVDVIWALVKPQADKIGVDVEEFCKRCKPEVMKEANAVFFDEWINFFQKLGRDAVATAMIQTKSLQTETIAKAVEQLTRLRDIQADLLSKAMTDQVDQALAEVKKLQAPQLPPVPVVTNGQSSANVTNSPVDSESATSAE